MALNDFSNVTVSGDGPALTQVGFGTILVAGWHSKFSEYTRTYTSLSGMVTDGFATTDPEYRAVERVFQQNPRLPSVKVGRLEGTAPTMTQRLTPLPVSGATYAIAIEICGKPKTVVSYTSTGLESVDVICDGLQAAIEALDGAGEPFEGLTVTPVGGATATALDLSVAAGVVFYMSGWRADRLLVEDRTQDPGIAADLATIRLADADWYGFGITVNANDVIEEAADWAETELVLFGANTSDSKAYDSGDSTDIQSVLAAKSYVRDGIAFSLNNQDNYTGLAMLGERFPFDPGTGPSAGGTFHGKTLAGVIVDSLTPTQQANLEAKGYTIYISTAGRNHTKGGKSPSGEYLDYTRFVDWFVIRLQEAIATLILNNDRVPYDERGISQVESVGRAMVSRGLASGGVSPLDADGNPPSVTVPKLSDTTSTERGNRILGGGGMHIGFKYAGAIHFVNVGITVTV